MKFSIILIIITLITQLSPDNAYYNNLARLIMEKEDSEQIKSLTNKFDAYNKDSSTVFLDGWYYYDTINQKFQNSRGTTDALKRNIYWFLLIDNLQFDTYIYEFDWKQPENEILGIIGSLAKKKNYELPKIPNVPHNSQLDAGGKLSFYNQTLKKYGFTLVNLYIDSDSYVTALIRRDNIKELIEISAQSHNIISEY